MAARQELELHFDEKVESAKRDVGEHSRHAFHAWETDFAEIKRRKGQCKTCELVVTVRFEAYTLFTIFLVLFFF